MITYLKPWESYKHDNLKREDEIEVKKKEDISKNSEDDSEKEDDELKLYLSIVQDEEKEVDYEILDRKYPIIDWKTVCLGTKLQEDLNAVFQLVMDKYQDEMPEGFERVLWGDLMVLFNPDEQDEFLESQHELEVIVEVAQFPQEYTL
ncbi:hypothetical protein Tco_1154027 [Tanacetum coccineum]